jgi:ParB-like chromosome segregation protein Spo0J
MTTTQQRGIESISIDTLSHDPANVRTHSERNIRAIAASLKRFGQQKPIVVDGKGVVVAGNGTLEAARSLGWDSIDAVRTGLKGSEATAFAIADNRTSELADWDYSALADQLDSLMKEDIDLPSIGWEPHEYEPLLQSDFDPRMTAYGGDGDSVTAVRSLKLTAEQRELLDKAIGELRVREDNESLGEGQCIEIICAEWMG